ncbi:hypothetical protein LCGC14_1485470 [marine sediment metagenome]|uniref:Uncharacterized protein n=1 Tax=marine sediment metagenome TaxID=412755 RepID=A0A0F9J8X9_9ZZZZ
MDKKRLLKLAGINEQIRPRGDEFFRATSDLGTELAKRIIDLGTQLSPDHPEWTIDIVLDRMKEVLDQAGQGSRIKS